MVCHCSVCCWMPLMICHLELDHYPPFDPLWWDNAEEGVHNHEYHLRSLSPCLLHESEDSWSIHPEPWLPSSANSLTSSLWGSDSSGEGNSSLPSLDTISENSEGDSEVRVAVRNAADRAAAEVLVALYSGGVEESSAGDSLSSPIVL